MSLQDTLNIGIFLIVILIALINYIFQRRQAAAMQQINLAAQRWLEMQIKDRRAYHAHTAKDLEPVQWIAAQLTEVMPGLSVSKIERTAAEVQALELATNDGQRLVISTQTQHVLRAFDHSQKKGGDRLSQFAARPLLGRRVQAVRLSLATNEWLDIEATAIAQKLGLSWDQPEQLWVYLTA